MKRFFNTKTTNRAVGNIMLTAGILTLSAALFCSPAIAQDAEVKNETEAEDVTVSQRIDSLTKETVEPTKTKEKWVSIEKHRSFRKKYYSKMLIDWGFNRVDKFNMLSGAEDVGNNQFPRLRNSKSTAFSISAVTGRKIVGGLSIYSGVGFDWLNYRFSNDVTLREIDEVTSIVHLADVYPNFNNTEKSKIVLSYITIPLMLHFKMKAFHIAAGLTGSLNINGYARIIYSDMRGNIHKLRSYDMQPATFRYGYSVRAGFTMFGVFANYYMTPIFSRHEGPQVYPFSFGIAFNLSSWR